MIELSHHDNNDVTAMDLQAQLTSHEWSHDQMAASLKLAEQV